jgi:hypothetical protein
VRATARTLFASKALSVSEDCLVSSFVTEENRKEATIHRKPSSSRREAIHQINKNAELSPKDCLQDTVELIENEHEQAYLID